MPKQPPESNEKYSRIEELALMRMSIKALRDRINGDLDAMLDRINRLIPAAETRRSNQYKNFSTAEWGEFLDS